MSGGSRLSGSCFSARLAGIVKNASFASEKTPFPIHRSSPFTAGSFARSRYLDSISSFITHYPSLVVPPLTLDISMPFGLISALDILIAFGFSSVLDISIAFGLSSALLCVKCP